jgi:hypothetical protein
MRRTTSTVVVFYIIFNAALTLLETVGWFDQIGIGGNVRAGTKLQEASEAIRSFSAGGGITDTLIAVYAGATSTFQAFALGAFAGADLLIGLGVPASIVIFIHSPLPIFIGLDGLYTLSGREV